MKRPKFYVTALLAAIAMNANGQVTPVSQMEKLDRGVVAVPTSGSTNFISWRLLGTDDKEATTFDLKRNGTVIAQDLKKTNYTDTQGSSTDQYTVVTKVDGKETEESGVITPWGKKFLTLKLDRPAKGSNGGTYSPNDMSVGDVDGDGQYELIVKWDPSNSKDNSEAGVTDNVIIDCYKMDATKLWRIDLGRNIRAGAHYTQFLVYDFDGDGKAEMICKTAPGSKDGGDQYVNQAAIDETIKAHDNTMTYADSNGRVNDGPEYLTIFNGETGKAIHTTWYLPNRAGNFNKEDKHPSTGYWGDNYGGRADRFLASVAYLNGADKLPCAVFSRGYYTRAFIWAVSFDGQQIHTEWLHDSESTIWVNRYVGDELTVQPRKAYTNRTSGIKTTDGDGCGSSTMYGNGNHNMAVADVDGDGCDEIIWGSAAVNNDGTLLYATGYGHGDAMHVGKMIPDREGLQVFDVHEDKIKNGFGSWDLHDALTGEILHKGGNDEKDNGRGMAADLTASNRGYEFWSSDERRPRSAETGSEVIAKSCSVNFRIYWDGDAQDELFDGNAPSSKPIANPYIQKWNGSSFTNIIADFNTEEYNYGHSCNTTKATPCLQADILGDWREELILWNYNDPSEINIYTTTIATEHAVPTLMHDHTYRMAITWQQTAYNQPPHLGYYLPDYLEGKITGMNAVITVGGEKTETIYDLSGRKIDTLKPGINIVRTKTAKGTEVKKVIVK